MADLEDGEIIDSDEEDASTEQGAGRTEIPASEKQSFLEKGPAWSLQHRAIVDEASRSSYRSSTPHDMDSSSDSLESDEDSDIWKSKQAKYFRKKSKDMEVSDVDGASDNKNGLPKSGRKKTNNIWGSVIEEQDLTSSLRSVDVEHKLTYNSERNVESYDFTNKYNDPRPDLDESEIPVVESHDPFDRVLSSNPGRSIIDYEDTVSSVQKHKKLNRKRKFESMDCHESRVSERLGPKRLLTTRLGTVQVTKDNTDEEVVKAIVDALNEPNGEIIERVVETLGKEFALRILTETKNVEVSGGMMINDGSRRRTPGGVYIQLMKSDKECTNKHKKVIFKDNNLYRDKPRKKSRNRNRRNRTSKAQGQADGQNSGKNSENEMDGEDESGMFGNIFKETTSADFMCELEETKKLILDSKGSSQSQPDNANKMEESHVCRNPENGEEMRAEITEKAADFDTGSIDDLEAEESHVVDVPIGDY